MAVQTTHTTDSLQANIQAVSGFATADGDASRTGKFAQDARTMSGGPAAEIYAHALILEREAIGCYLAFAECLETRGDEETATLFRQLARRKGEYIFALISEVAVRQELAQLAPRQYGWLSNGPAERGAYEFVFHLMTPWNALNIALSAISRAKVFFEQVTAMTTDAQARTMAMEMVREESDHISCLKAALERTPRPIMSEDDMEQLVQYRAAA